MAKTNAEHQALHRQRRLETMAALRAEVEQLRATSKSTPAPEASHGAAMERRLRELEQMVQGLDRRLDQIESMAHGAY